MSHKWRYTSAPSLPPQYRVKQSPASCTLRGMIVLDKLCFALSASFRLAGRSSTLRSTTTSSFSRLASTMSATSESWPSPEAFNALPQSTRTKVYCDYGDVGKMAWKPHDEPPKVKEGTVSRSFACVQSRQLLRPFYLAEPLQTAVSVPV